MEDVFVPIAVVGMLFIGLPWLFLHYMTSWKRSRGLSEGDENLLDEMHDISRRLEERVLTVERILTAENPKWREASLPSRNDYSKDIDHVRSSH